MKADAACDTSRPLRYSILLDPHPSTLPVIEKLEKWKPLRLEDAILASYYHNEVSHYVIKTYMFCPWSHIRVILYLNMNFGWELIVLHTTLSMFGSVEVWMKNIPCWSIEAQTHFGMPRGAKMSSALNNWNKLLFVQIQTLPLSMHLKWKEIIDIYAKQWMKNHRGPSPDKMPHWVNG